MLSRRALFPLLPAAAHAQTRFAGLPNVGLSANTSGPRSECGVGALMPWAGALWAVTYNSHKQSTGTGLGLYRIEESFEARAVHEHNGTHANRLVHQPSNQVFIGPYAIDDRGNARFLPALAEHRLTATMPHLTDPDNRVYFLTMEGLLFEHDVSTHQSRQVDDLVQRFQIKQRPHFKGGFTAQGRMAVTNNGFYEFGDAQAGLFEFDGRTWRALSRKPHMDVAARGNFGSVLFATGWDESSVLFWALVKGEWQRFRLPKSSNRFNHAWQTEWMRIREVETEHFLMDIHGMFYELQPLAFEGRIWGVKPICAHLRTIPDYSPFRGLLALGGNEGSPNAGNNPLGGQPQSGIWFGKTDDLWSWGKPAGWGGPWRKSRVTAGQASEPYLMTGFDKKVLHLLADKACTFAIEVDFLGDGTWAPYERIAVGAGAYRYHVFPAGFSAHWVRLTPSASCTASAELIYT